MLLLSKSVLLFVSKNAVRFYFAIKFFRFKSELNKKVILILERHSFSAQCFSILTVSNALGWKKGPVQAQLST